MARNLAKKLEEKLKQTINFSECLRLRKELFDLTLELRSFLIRQKIEIRDGEIYQFSNLPFSNNSSIFGISFNVKKIMGLIDNSQIFIILKKGNLIEHYAISKRRNYEFGILNSETGELNSIK